MRARHRCGLGDNGGEGMMIVGGGYHAPLISIVYDAYQLIRVDRIRVEGVIVELSIQSKEQAEVMRME